jgi:SurA N-terminal domain
MFGTIRRHQKWLWAVIITVTIISFVIFFSPYSKMNNPRRGNVDLGTVAGRRVSEDDFVNAQREIYVRFFVSNGRWPDEQARQNVEHETYEWLLLTREQERLGIHISSAMIAEVGRNMLSGLQRAGVTSPELLEKLLQQNGFQLEDFERYVRHVLGVQELIATLGLSGELVPPEQVKGLYQSEHQELATEAVFFAASNYLAGVTIAPEALNQYYTNNLATYRIPDRVQVSYVEIPASNYLAKARQYWEKTNLTEVVEANYQRLGTNAFPDAKTPEDIKTRIREEIILDKALLEARIQANHFAAPLFDLSKPRTEDFAVFAKTNGLEVRVTEPFDARRGPKDLEVNADFVRTAFKLSPEDPIAGPLMGRKAVYVIALNRKLPSEVPSLDKIQEQVMADCKYEQAKNLARQAGGAFYSVLTNSLAQGKPFAAICAEARAKPVALPPFSLSTRSLPEIEEEVDLSTLKQMSFSTEPGKAIPFLGSVDGGLVVFVKSKLPINDTRMKADLPGFTSSVRQQRQTEAFNEWFSQEFSRGVHAPRLAEQAQRPPAALNSRKPKAS